MGFLDIDNATKSYGAHEVLHKVDISCKAGSIPDELVVDVSHLDLGDALLEHGLELPEGAEMETHAELPVAAVVVPRGIGAEEEEAAAEGEEAVEAAEDGEEKAEDSAESSDD